MVTIIKSAVKYRQNISSDLNNTPKILLIYAKMKNHKTNVKKTYGTRKK